MLRYAVAAAKLAEPSTTYASSSFTRYRNGLSPVFSPDAFLPLTRPQMVSTNSPRTFFRTARFISTNSADAGFSSFAAIVAFALTMTGSEVPAGGPDAAGSTIAAILVDFVFFASGWVVSVAGFGGLFRLRGGGFHFRWLGFGVERGQLCLHRLAFSRPVETDEPVGFRACVHAHVRHLRTAAAGHDRGQRANE